jgi:hypothetical protein
MFPENFKETLFEDSKPESPQILLKKSSNPRLNLSSSNNKSKNIEILSDEVLDDASILTSDIDENILSDNHKMWMTILT